MILFGIIQGRLTPSSTGELQCFPISNWQQEFALSKECGYDYIELFNEELHNPNNPIWSKDGITRIKDLVQQHQLSILSLCHDYIIQHSLLDTSTQDYTKKLLNQAAQLGASIIVFPLFKASELNLGNHSQFQSVLCKIADYATSLNIILSLETILPGTDNAAFFDRCNHPNIKLTYDTGNCISAGHDIYHDLEFLRPYINHIHIKDKNTQHQNVCLGQGHVNFKRICSILKQSNYNNGLTFETDRGTNPVQIAVSHIKLIKTLLS